MTIDDELVKCYSEIFKEFKDLNESESQIIISINVKHTIVINNETDILFSILLFLKV